MRSVWCMRRLRREFKLDLSTGAVQVAYREGVREATTHESRHAATPGGAQEIEVVLAIEPHVGLAWATADDAKKLHLELLQLGWAILCFSGLVLATRRPEY